MLAGRLTRLRARLAVSGQVKSSFLGPFRNPSECVAPHFLAGDSGRMRRMAPSKNAAGDRARNGTGGMLAIVAGALAEKWFSVIASLWDGRTKPARSGY
jgi:hypothetical protein